MRLSNLQFILVLFANFIHLATSAPTQNPLRTTQIIQSVDLEIQATEGAPVRLRFFWNPNTELFYPLRNALDMRISVHHDPDRYYFTLELQDILFARQGGPGLRLNGQITFDIARINEEAAARRNALEHGDINNIRFQLAAEGSRSRERPIGTGTPLSVTRINGITGMGYNIPCTPDGRPATSGKPVPVTWVILPTCKKPRIDPPPVSTSGSNTGYENGSRPQIIEDTLLPDILAYPYGRISGIGYDIGIVPVRRINNPSEVGSSRDVIGSEGITERERETMESLVTDLLNEAIEEELENKSDRTVFSGGENDEERTLAENLWTSELLQAAEAAIEAEGNRYENTGLEGDRVFSLSPSWFQEFLDVAGDVRHIETEVEDALLERAQDLNDGLLQGLPGDINDEDVEINTDALVREQNTDPDADWTTGIFGGNGDNDSRSQRRLKNIDEDLPRMYKPLEEYKVPKCGYPWRKKCYPKNDFL